MTKVMSHTLLKYHCCFKYNSYFRELTFMLNWCIDFSRKKKKASNIEDIYDGKLYKAHSKAGAFLNIRNNISLMWYTDGVPLFKSSKVSIWPLFFSVNELPVQDRFKQENMLFAGLWFGHSKPSMSFFLNRFMIAWLNSGIRDMKLNVTVSTVHL